jgi:hypothetical protein
MARDACGHQSGFFHPNAPWDKELEADRFAGHAIRRFFEEEEYDRTVTEQKLLAAIREVFVINAAHIASPTHPPLELRLAAFSDGWRNGSPCKERGFVKGPTEPDKESIKKAELEFCAQMARELCEASDIETKAHDTL